MASHHTRAFNYESIHDQQEAIEMWRDLAIGGGLLLLGLFCPPAGGFVLAASLTMSAADMYSALSGKDWGTGRELDPTERGLRGFFALIDLVPGGISLIKGGKGTGKLVGKQLLKEGAEQGAHTIDDGLKTLAKFGDETLQQVDDFGKQANYLLENSGGVGSSLKNADQPISQAAKKFTLNAEAGAINAYETIDFSKIDFDIELIRNRLKTDPNTAFFWSGRTDGIGGADTARNIAKSEGGVTLESTIDDTNIIMPEWDFNSPSSIKAWELSSNAYAEQVSGEIRAVVGDELRPGNIWENVELPRLKNNPNVTRIIIIDPKTKISKIIFER